MGVLENLDPSKWSLGTDIMSKVGTISYIIIYAFIIVIILVFIFKFFQYRISIELWEKRGTTPIIIGNKKAKKVVKGDIEEYEFLEKPIGVFLKKFRKTFRIDDNKFIIPTNKGISFKLEKVGTTYHPIGISNPELQLERVSQSHLWWLTNKLMSIHQKYDEKKWWEAYIMPFSFVIVAIIEFIIIAMVLDKAADIQGVCRQAEENLGSKLVQSIK